MEQQNFLQRPGGLGPMPGLKPLGMPMAQPSAYMNDTISVRARQQAAVDDVNRVLAQYKIDNGEYLRTPVSPAEYGIGNMTPSAQQTGVAGYNHREVPLPERAVDMPKEQYVVDEANSADPAFQHNVKQLTMLPQQPFYNVTTPDSTLPALDFRSPGDLTYQKPTMRNGQ